MCGESWLFNPLPQFSRLGTWCPTFYVNACISVFVYLGGGFVWDFFFFLLHFFTVRVVCYTHTFHATMLVMIQ